MLQHRSYIQIDLERGEATSLVHAQGNTLRCLRGTLWVTEDNGGGDVVLEAGQSYALTRRGRTVVQSVATPGGACCQVLLARSPRRPVATLRLLLSLLLAGPTKRQGWLSGPRRA